MRFPNPTSLFISYLSMFSSFTQGAADQKPALKGSALDIALSLKSSDYNSPQTLALEEPGIAHSPIHDERTLPNPMLRGREKPRITISRQLPASLTGSGDDSKIVVAYWCGPNYGCGGASTSFDTIPDEVTHVHLAFATIAADGTVSYEYYPPYVDSDFSISDLQDQGKKVLISVGGAAQDFTPCLENPETCAQSIKTLLDETGADGIDLDIEPMIQGEEQIDQVITLIKTLRDVLGDKALICIAPECPGVYNGESYSSQYNTYVDVINETKDYLSYVFVQCYNNWCSFSDEGTVDSFKDIYNSWVLPFILTDGTQYGGLAAEKFVLGLLGGSTATGFDGSGGADPDVVEETVEELSCNAGYWDAIKDQACGFCTSSAIADGQAAAIKSLSPQSLWTGEPALKEYISWNAEEDTDAQAAKVLSFIQKVFTTMQTSSEDSQEVATNESNFIQGVLRCVEGAMQALSKGDQTPSPTFEQVLGCIEGEKEAVSSPDSGYSYSR